MKRWKCSILLVMLFAAVQFLSALDFSEVRNFRTTRKGSWITVIDGKQHLASIYARKGGDISLLKVSLENGELQIDSSEYYRQTPKAELIMHLRAGKPVGTDCENMLTVEMRTDVPGTVSHLSLCGEKKKSVKGSRQFWAKPLPRALLAESRKFTSTRFIPPEVERLHALFYLRPGGKVFIRSVALSLPPKKAAAKIDPEKNWIINGGAERGFYMTVPTDLADFAQPNAGGGYHTKFGVWKKGSVYSIDDKNARTGKYAFKIQSFEASNFDRLTFAPVPTVSGKPLSFSAWMRSEKPAMVQMWFNTCSGYRYCRQVRATPEWKKYTFTVPHFGAKISGKGGWSSGEPGNTARYDMIFPAILVMGKGTVYVDDVRCQHKLSTSDEGEKVPVRVTGTLDHESSYYFAGEVMNAEIKADSDQPGSGTVGWKLYDFYGKVIAEGKPEKVSFPMKRKFTVNVPEGKRGAMTLVFSVTPDGASVIEHGFPCGVIDKPEKLDPRFGLNFFMQYQPGKLLPIMKDFGIGSIRLSWANVPYLQIPQADSSAAFHKAGIFVFYSLTRPLSGRAGYMLPKDPTEFLRTMENWIKTVTKGNVDVYDLLNEPNAWHSKNPDPEKYLDPTVEEVTKLEKKMAEVIHRCDPGVAIAAPSVCDTRIGYMDTFLRLGGAEFTDILTEHPYRAYAEMPDYYDDIQTIHDFSKKYGKKFRLISSERGIRRPLFNRHAVYTAQERNSILVQCRIMLTALAGGMEQFYSFLSYGLNPGVDFFDTAISANSGKSVVLPGPLFYCMNAAANALRDAVPVKRIPLGFEQRCFLFRRKDGSSCVMLWKWHGDPASIVFPLKMIGTDMMGSRIGGTKFLLTAAPIYLHSPLTPEELEKQIRNAKMEATGDAALARLVAAGKDRFFVKVSNLSPSEISGKVEIDPECVKGTNVRTFANLEPQKDILLPFESAEPLSLKKQFVKGKILADGRKPVNFKLDFSGIVCPKTPQKLKIDGDLSDWPENAASFTLDSSCAAAPWKQTPEEKNLRADVRLCWDSDYLYVSVEANKKLQISELGNNIVGMWNNDGIQIAFDPLSNAMRPRTGYLDDDFEYWISRLKGKVIVWRDHASASRYDSFDKRLGVISDVPAAIVEKDGKTIYEFAFPTFTVSPFQLLPGSSMRFNIIVNVSNGKVRRGFLQLAPGIGQVPKSPFDFIHLTLIDK